MKRTNKIIIYWCVTMSINPTCNSNSSSFDLVILSIRISNLNLICVLCGSIDDHMIFDHFHIFIKFHSAAVAVAACIFSIFFSSLWIHFFHSHLSNIHGVHVCVCAYVYCAFGMRLDLISDEIRKWQSQRH